MKPKTTLWDGIGEHWQGDLVNCYQPIRLQFCSMVCSFFVIHNFIFHFLHCYFVSPVKGSFLQFTIAAQLVVCMLMVWVTWVWFPGRLFFFITRSAMAVKAVKRHLFFKSLHLFSFFLYSHSRMRGVQLISQCVMTKITLLLHNTFSECIIVNLTTSVQILTQRWMYIWFILPRWWSPPKKFVCVRLETSTVLGATPSIGTIKKQSAACRSWQSVDQNIDSNTIKGELWTSKCQALSLFDEDSPEKAKIEKSTALLLFSKEKRI
jgi:hypothetical protein